MHDGVSELVEKYFFRLQKMSRLKDGKSLIQEILNKRLVRNLKCGPKDFFVSFNGITFHSWKESLYNLLTQGH